jgi:hypothetical protein
MNDTKKILTTAAVIGLCILAFIGVGFAFQASITSAGNNVDYQYVTLNPEGSSGAILAYHQDYDTFTSGGKLYYSLPAQSGTSKIPLHASPYTITVEGNVPDQEYEFCVSAPDLPDLEWASGTNQYRRYFVFELSHTVGMETTTIYGLDPDGDGDYLFFDELNGGNGQTISSITHGAYSLRLFLQMHTTSTLQANGEYGILVDKTGFVDEFHAEDIDLRFVVRAVLT